MNQDIVINYRGAKIQVHMNFFLVMDGKLIVISTGLGSGYCNRCELSRQQANSLEFVEKNWPFKVTRNITSLNENYDAQKKSKRGQNIGKIIKHTGNKEVFSSDESQFECRT